MRAIVEIRFGSLQGRKAIIEPGKTLRIGREVPADLVVLRDDQMSKVHCEIGWDGRRCTLRDLKSIHGTFLDGERVDAAEVAHGAWIKAGETVAMVYFEEKTPPRPGSDAEMTSVKAAALAGLSGEREPLFALLDAARTDRILEVLRESVEEHRSLYEGVEGEKLADVAPYLVGLPRGSRLLERLVREGWGKRWGIYLTSRRPFKEVRTHLRRFLMVEHDETGERMYFRFYDPATLRVWMPVCTARQRVDLFGEISAYLSEDEDGRLRRFEAQAG